jgi:hypothetical protein
VYLKHGTIIEDIKGSELSKRDRKAGNTAEKAPLSDFVTAGSRRALTFMR